MKKIFLNEDTLHNIIIEGVLIENKKVAKQYLESGKINQEQFQKIEKIDPTPTKKYMGWMGKQISIKDIDEDTLRNAIHEYDNILRAGGLSKIEELIKHKGIKDTQEIEKLKSYIDIYKIKTFEDLRTFVDDLMNVPSVKSKERESKFEIMVDNSEIFFVRPDTHEATANFCQSKFGIDYEDSQGRKLKKSPWCTGANEPSNWQNYVYRDNWTFYYCLAFGQNVTKELKQTFGDKIVTGHGMSLPKYKAYQKMAIVMKPYYINGDAQEEVPFENKYYDAYDACDREITGSDGWSDFVKYWEIINKYAG